MMEDELMALLKNANPDELTKIEEKARLVGQDLQNIGAPADTSDPEAMKKAGYVFNGLGWAKT